MTPLVNARFKPTPGSSSGPGNGRGGRRGGWHFGQAELARLGLHDLLCLRSLEEKALWKAGIAGSVARWLVPLRAWGVAMTSALGFAGRRLEAQAGGRGGLAWHSVLGRERGPLP